MRAVQEGAQDYLVKGQVDGGTILRSVRYAIERKGFEEQRRRSDANFRSLIEHSPDLICVLRGTEIVYANPDELERLAGLLGARH